MAPGETSSNPHDFNSPSAEQKLLELRLFWYQCAFCNKPYDSRQSDSTQYFVFCSLDHEASYHLAEQDFNEAVAEIEAAKARLDAENTTATQKPRVDYMRITRRTVKARKEP